MSARELADYVSDQLGTLEGIRSIPMMGGYIFYINNRIFGGIYESGMMVKITDASHAGRRARAPLRGREAHAPRNDPGRPGGVLTHGVADVRRASRAQAEEEKDQGLIFVSATRRATPSPGDHSC